MGPRAKLPPIVLSGVPSDKVGTLAGRVIERRLALKLTRAALAQKAGVSETSIRDLESQRTKSTRELLRISDALEVGPHWLMYGGPSRPVSSATTILADAAGQALQIAGSTSPESKAVAIQHSVEKPLEGAAAVSDGEE